MCGVAAWNNCKVFPQRLSMSYRSCYRSAVLAVAYSVNLAKSSTTVPLRPQKFSTFVGETNWQLV